MPVPASVSQASAPRPGSVARSRSPGPAARRTAITPTAATAASPGATVRRGLPPQVTEAISSPGAGEPLVPSTRAALERSLDFPLGAVRVHTDQKSRSAAGAMGARAFTFGTHVFLGTGEQPTDLALMGHEVAHVIQQQGAPVVQTAAATAGGDRFEAEAHRISTAVTQGQKATVEGRTGGAQVQALGLSDILDGLASLAANVPGFTLLTVIIGRNPINMRVVDRNFVNILRGFMGLIPGGELLFQILDRYGVVQRIGAWVSDQVSAMGLSFDYFRQRFNEFTDSLSWRDIFSPGDVWRRAQAIFTEPINRIRNFISRLISQAITWLKETFMQPLSEFCRQIPGYTLVTVLLGRDPFTNAPVPRTALNVVRAFAEFIPGGTEKVNQLIESRALERAYQWFGTETQARNLTWARVAGTFTGVWNSLQLEDVLHPIDTVRRVVGMFRPLMSDLVSFAGAALMKLLELIFEAVMGAGGARILAILKRGRDTFLVIIRNPVGFLRNLLGAVGQGVRQFMTNILRHLRDGVIAWLTGPVAAAGIQMPEQWDLKGIIWFVLQILGLTWPRVREKLVRLLGERVVATLEAGFQLLQEIREKGIVQALRDRVTEFFGQLRDAALNSIRSFIQQRLVMAGITQLISLLNPVGAVIQAIIKTYTTIQFFIQRINQILELVESVVNSIAAIASGAIGSAAGFVERTMARTIPIILDFLARFIGLGDVGGHVQRTIRNLQQTVDRMLDRAVDWIRNMAGRIATSVTGAVRGAVARIFNWWTERRRVRTADGQEHNVYFQRSGTGASLIVASAPRPARDHLMDVINGAEFDDATKALARDALQYYQTNIEPAAGQAAQTSPPPQIQALIDVLPASLTTFAGKLLRIGQGSAGDLPNRAIWRSQAVPKAAHVELLSHRTSRGGTDARTGNPPGWPVITSHGLTTARGNWVRMHLITASVGGHDNDANLLPTPTAVNTGGVVRGFETQLEQTIYGAANPRDRRTNPSIFRQMTRPTVVWISSAVQGYHPAYTDIGGTPVYNASTFATGVHLSAGLHYFRNNAWTKDPTVILERTVSVPSPDLAGAYRPNFNSIGRQIIIRQTEISENLAREIIEERGGTPAARPYNSFAHLLTRMFTYRRANNIPITPEFTAAIQGIGAATIRQKIKWRD